MALTHPFTVACAAACLAWAARADVRTVKTVATYLDGRQEQRTYSVSQEGRTATLIISAAEVGAGVKALDVIPSFARTRTGEAGYFLTPDGILGRFHETNGVFCVGEGRNYMPFYGMKTPRDTFCVIAKGMSWRYATRVEARKGVYQMSQRYNLGGREEREIRHKYGIARAYAPGFES